MSYHRNPAACWLILTAVFAAIAIGLSFTLCPGGVILIPVGFAMVCACNAADEFEGA